MELHLFMAQRNCSYDGEYAPEVLVGWDSISVMENPDGWEQACKEALDACGGISFKTHEVGQAKVVIVNVAGLGDVFDIQTLSGTVKG